MSEQEKPLLDASNENLRDLTRVVNQHISAKETASKQGGFELSSSVQTQSQTMTELLSILQKDNRLIDVFVVNGNGSTIK